MAKANSIPTSSQPRAKSHLFCQRPRIHTGDNGQAYQILQIVPARGVSARFEVEEDSELVPVLLWALVQTELGPEGDQEARVMGMVIQEDSARLVFAQECQGFKEYSYQDGS